MRNPYINIQDDISNMNMYVRTYVRTSRNQYVPYFFKVGGIIKGFSQCIAANKQQWCGLVAADSCSIVAAFEFFVYKLDLLLLVAATLQLLVAATLQLFVCRECVGLVVNCF